MKTKLIQSNNEIINILRNNGFKVKVKHYRRDILGNLFQNHYFKGPLARYLNNYGGETELTFQKDGKTYYSNAICSIKDCFNKKYAVRLCLLRMIASLLEYRVIDNLDFEIKTNLEVISKFKSDKDKISLFDYLVIKEIK